MRRQLLTCQPVMLLPHLLHATLLGILTQVSWFFFSSAFTLLPLPFLHLCGILSLPTLYHSILVPPLTPICRTGRRIRNVQNTILLPASLRRLIGGWFGSFKKSATGRAGGLVDYNLSWTSSAAVLIFYLRFRLTIRL